MQPTAPHRANPTSLKFAGLLLGFALGGFFDGILLHQILQWHHLLSSLQQTSLLDLRSQILADGVFHALMYVIAAIGLWFLWRSRWASVQPHAGRFLAAAALLGFGLWHVIDAVFFHWLLGIHRIRMDTAYPLLWDLLWLIVFGFGAIIVAWLIWSRSGPGAPPSQPKRAATGALGLLTIAAGAVAALPPAGGSPTLVLFRAGLSTEQMIGAIDAVDGRLVWADAAHGVWAIEPGRGHSSAALYMAGALLVSSSVGPAGCFPWLRQR